MIPKKLCKDYKIIPALFFFSGRGRGESGFYQRSFDDVEGAFGRGGNREMHRSQSWEER